MRRHLVVVTAVLICVGLLHPAEAKLAKSRPLVVKDAAGDANGLNTQFGLIPAGPASVGTPVQDAGSDIVSFSLSRRTQGPRITSLVATMTLSAAPSPNRNFRIRMSSPDCTTYFIEYDTLAGFEPSGNLRDNCDPEATAPTFTDIDATVKGRTITWVIPIRALPGGVKLGTPLRVHGAQVSVETAVVIPGLDEVRVSAAYRVGQ